MYERKINHNDDVALLYAYCRNQERGWVKNRIKYPINIQGDKFVVILPNMKHVHVVLIGSITWGKSGFDFSVKLNKNDDVPMVNLNPHQGCTLTQSLMNDTILSILRMGVSDVKNRGFTIERGGIFKEPLLKALKNGSTKSIKNKERIKQFEQAGIFDYKFSEFLLKHEDNGIRCYGKNIHNN
jgi:hypothetical protein